MVTACNDCLPSNETDCNVMQRCCGVEYGGNVRSTLEAVEQQEEEKEFQK